MEPSCAILIDGSLAGLVAAWTHSACQPGGSGKPTLVLAPPSIPTQQTWAFAAARQPAACAIHHTTELVVSPRMTSPVNAPPRVPPAPGELSRLLLDAAVAAISLDVDTLIWPIAAAGSEDRLNVEAMADVCDRASLIAQLAVLDAPRVGPGSRGIIITTPYIDFTDAQLLELAIDTGTPLSAAALCEKSLDKRCGSCAECARWERALREFAPGASLSHFLRPTPPLARG